MKSREFSCIKMPIAVYEGSTVSAISPSLAIDFDYSCPNEHEYEVVSQCDFLNEFLSVYSYFMMLC